MKLMRVFGILVAIVTGVLALAIGISLLVYPPEYVYRTMVWQDSDAFDWQKFPSHPLAAAPKANPFEVRLNPRVPKDSRSLLVLIVAEFLSFFVTFIWYRQIMFYYKKLQLKKESLRIQESE